MTFDLFLVAVCIVVHIIKRPGFQFCRKNQIQYTKSLKVTNRNEHITANKDGTEIRRYVRIQIIGKDGVGKSSLVRRLIGDSNMKVHSTDGIDIVKNCQIRTTDGKWVIGRVETERNKIINRILETLQRERELENHPATVSIDKSLTNENKVNIIETATSVAEKSNIDKPMKDNGVPSSKDFEKSTDSITIYDMRKRIFEKMDLILGEVKKDQERMTSERLVECGLWDFAGKKIYYATHQTFLNPHAIYLIVTNISEDIAATEDETDFDSIEEYMDFWFDSIYCLRTSSPGHGLYPPVIVVCTFIDEYKTEKEVEDRKKEYIKRFKYFFADQDKTNHNTGIYFISNTEFLKSDCNKLKKKISDVAKEMMYFAEELPMQWTQLENSLRVLRDDLKQNILSWQTFVELAEMLSIKEKDLFPFLTYQNKIGNIIFFADIKEYIILQPDWLVKCFRCLVCDNHRDKRNIEIAHLTDWHNLEKTGQLSDNIIDRLFEKEPDLEFGKYKTHILSVMEKFDIIVKPKFTSTNNDSSLIHNSYFMPCMLTTQTTYVDIIQQNFGSERSSFSFSPWLILEFKFLPLAYFYHILFYYITRYTVCEEKGGRKSLYRGKALVNLDNNGISKLCICFSKNVIALQVWRLSAVEYSRYDTILDVLCRKIETLKKKFSQNISYDIKAKCKNGNYFNKQGRITYKELRHTCEQGHYWCPEHKELHSKDDVEKTWLQHADMVMAKLNETQAEHKPRNSIENIPTVEEVYVKYNLPVSVTLRQQVNVITSNKEYPINLDCTKVGNTLVFIDQHNKRLIICNSDGTRVLYHIDLPHAPWYITDIDSNSVAVSCTFESTILIINISTCSTTSTITRTIKTSEYCYGISYNDKKLYVVIDRSKIQVMDLTGKEIRPIPLPSDRIHNFTFDRDRLVCINYTSIYCRSLDGHVIWDFKNDQFQNLRCVTTDDERNVYVTDERTNNVVVVFSDGKRYKDIITKSDGLNRPRGIYFDKKEKILLVCNYGDGKAFLFVKKTELS